MARKSSVRLRRTGILIIGLVLASMGGAADAAAQSAFVMQQWKGAWGSDGPTFTGDLNGDGRTDVFMWRDSDKSWTVNLSSGTGFVMQQWKGAWGSDGPIFTGDLNGDGKTDVFMWRDSDKSWTVNLSTGTGFVMQQWKGAWGSDGPIFTGDLNGDGKADVFMWRASDKSWTVNLSTGTGFVMRQWKGAWGSDGPIFTGDLNGDGKTDVFMWRASDKSWTVNLSTGSGFAMRRWTGAWGSDGPIFTGDLNGDGKTDVFMWRASDKSWTVNLSTGTGFVMQQWKGAWGSDGPTFIGDLNGDGKTDVFMWRDSDKSWTVNLSTGTGFVMQQWKGAWGSDGPIFTGDLNGDGKTDVFMWRDSDKSWTVNLTTPAAAVSTLAFLPPAPGSFGCPTTSPTSHMVNGIDHPDVFDRVSCFMPRPKTELWTISRPDVTKAEAGYPSVRFRRGDLVTILAGGCAQTGATGYSWKRYVRPLNGTRVDDDKHFGSLRIPGVLPSTRLNDALQRPPIPIPSDPGADAFLRLQYGDDNYRDNGYWGNDNGWYEQCRSMEEAWVAVLIQHGCAASSDPACSTASPLDLTAVESDANGLPLQPQWGLQRTVGILPDPAPLCNLSHKSVGMPEDGVELCTRQVTEKNNDPTKCPQGEKSAALSAMFTQGRIGGHVNWAAATYQGFIEWGDHSTGVTGDDDYNFFLTVDGGPGSTTTNAENIALEFKAAEVVDKAGSAWWKSFRAAVDAADNGRVPLAGGTPGQMIGDHNNKKQAIIVGLLGLDCAHACGSELHPVYVMAVRIKEDPADDTWVLFARNWGNEGYCGPDDRPLRRGDPVVGNLLDQVTILLPPPSGGTWKSASVLDQTEMKFSNGIVAMGYSTAPRTGGLGLTFKLLPHDKISLIDGELHLRWNP